MDLGPGPAFRKVGAIIRAVPLRVHHAWAHTWAHPHARAHARAHAHAHARAHARAHAHAWVHGLFMPVARPALLRIVVRLWCV